MCSSSGDVAEVVLAMVPDIGAATRNGQGETVTGIVDASELIHLRLYPMRE